MPALFLVCALAALVPIWSVKYLPMTDLPQHAAQIHLWQNLANPDYARLYEINWFTPYVAGYALARAIADFTGVLVAWKLVISGAVLALPASLAYLFRAAGRDPAWGLIGFPLAFGYSFYWGFLNFLVAMPLGIALLGAIVAHGEAPTKRGAIGLALGATLLFFGHVLVMLAVVGAGGLWLLARRGFLYTLPLAAPLPVVVAWTIATRSADTQVREMTMIAGPPAALRLIGLPGILLGSPGDAAALFTGSLVFLLIVLSMRLSRELHRYGPLLVALVAYVLGPHRAFGTYYLYGRFAVLVLPAVVLAFEPLKRPRVSNLASQRLLALIALGWMAVITGRFHRFDAEAAQFDRVTAGIPKGAKIVSLCWNPESRDIPGQDTFLHFPAWVQADRGGVLGFSFATFFPEMIRYRPGMRPPQTVDLEWRPDKLDWQVDSYYDWFVARHPGEPPLAKFPLDLVKREGQWSLYRKR